MPDEGTDNPEYNLVRWLLLVFVVAVLLGLGGLSLYYHSQSSSHDIACAHAESHCDGL